eukprot:m.28312 g.28312  ORF g.28312 m.28312 type:complete len:676 (+) comp7993_c0_seq1:98-2125(+)
MTDYDKYYNSIQNPVWSTDIEELFSKPRWVPAGSERENTAGMWVDCMKGDVNLSSYTTSTNKEGEEIDGVKEQAVEIYRHLRSRMMPIGENPMYFPESALEMFRRWVNNGSPEKVGYKITKRNIIPAPKPAPPLLHRKDILSLSPSELYELRCKLEDNFKLFEVFDENGDKTPWQVIGDLHRFWCLHHQEGFLPWHRCYMKAFEKILGMPLPYWNWTAQDVSQYGVPQCFLDETYVRDGETRPNPLRWARALDGKSHALVMYKDAKQKWKYPTPPAPYNKSEPTSWIQTPPEFYLDSKSDAFKAKMLELDTYASQVLWAMHFDTWSKREGTGMPWDEGDPRFPDRDIDFDGAFEIPHDNMHSWLGPDTTSNKTPGCVPIFWFFHANIDRMFEIWLRNNVTNPIVEKENGFIQCTVDYGLKPFVGKLGDEIDYSNPNLWMYTTIGDVMGDSRAMGYTFDEPEHPDIMKDGIDVKDFTNKALMVSFKNVLCTIDSFTVWIFANIANPTPDDTLATGNVNDGAQKPIKRSTVGMGEKDKGGRCIKNPVVRKFDATKWAIANQIFPDASSDDDGVKAFTYLVHNDTKQHWLSKKELEEYPGLIPHFAWESTGKAIPSHLTADTLMKMPKDQKLHHPAILNKQCPMHKKDKKKEKKKAASKSKREEPQQSSCSASKRTKR